MKIFSTISTYDDAVALQADLTRLEKYCAANHLELNPDKCSVVTFTRKHCPINFSYSVKEVNLRRVCNVRDLGVLYDSKLSFNPHMDYIISKAYRALGFVMRSSKEFSNIKTLKILYCTYVRSNLEYASQVWNPCYVTYINRIETLQKKFIRFLCYRLKERYNSNIYYELCRKHHLLPLVKRREISDITFLLKLASGSIDCPSLLSRISLKVPTRNLRQNELLHLPTASSNYKQNSYLWRASKNFNNINKSGLDLDLFNTGVELARRLLNNSFFNSNINSAER